MKIIAIPFEVEAWRFELGALEPDWLGGRLASVSIEDSHGRRSCTYQSLHTCDWKWDQHWHQYLHIGDWAVRLPSGRVIVIKGSEFESLFQQVTT